MSLAGPSVLYAYLFRESQQAQLSTTTARLERVSQIAQEHAQRVVETNEVIYRSVADVVLQAHPDDLRHDGTLHERLARLTTGLGQLQSVWIWDAEGRPVASSRMAVPPPGLRVDDRDYFKAAKNAAPGGGWVISEPLRSRATGEAFFDFSRRRSGKDGAFLGVISVSLFPSYFTRFFAEQAASDPAFSVGLFRSDGTVISRYPEVAFGSQLTAQSPLRSAMTSGREAGTHTGLSSLDGGNKIVSYRKVGQLPLYAVAVADLDRVLAPWRQSMLQLAAAMLVLALALAALCVLAIRMVRRDDGAERALREEAEQRLRAEEALRHAQKLEALGRLTGSVAHDFNNVLMVVQTSASLIGVLLGKGQSPERPLAAILRAVKTGSQLTRQLLAFARRQPVKVQPCKPSVTLEDMRPLVKSAVGSLVRVEFDIAPDLPEIQVDLADLELAMLNLVNNARDAMPRGGEVRLSASRIAAPGDSAPPGPWIRISVQDEGPGIPPELRDKVLEPFFTTKPPGKGTGLGLSQVLGFAEQSGGRVVVDNVPGHGAVVSVDLPCAAAGPTDTVAPEDAAPAPVVSRIVLVEDNLEIVDSLLPLLESLGARVRHFASADAALSAFRDGTVDVPDVLLSGIQMPGTCNGLDLAIEMRRRCPALPILLMTGYTEQLKAATAHGFTVLAKPVSSDRLNRALQDALDGSS